MRGTWVRRGIGGAVALGSAAALAALSFVPYTVEPENRAVIRLAWRARGERVHECRRLTPAELERLPPHMRQEEVCGRRILPYHLRVAMDGVPVVDEVIRAGGAREDRPLFVFRELAMAPGAHHLTVTFEREGGEAEEEEIETAREHAEETPRRLGLDETVVLEARQIILVTYDDETRRLRLLAPPRGGS